MKITDCSCELVTVMHVVAYEYVTCGSALKLLNTGHNVRLHSHDVKYGSGSGQQVCSFLMSCYNIHCVQMKSRPKIICCNLTKTCEIWLKFYTSEREKKSTSSCVLR